MKPASALIAFFFVAGCAIVPGGDDCPKAPFQSYFNCYEAKRAVPSVGYDKLIAYGRTLSAAVSNKTLSSEAAFNLFDQRRKDTQEQLVEAQSIALSNAMRRVSADPK